MDILTLELFDVTVSGALLEVRHAMETHPGLPLRIHIDADDMLRLNLQRYLERQGRALSIRAQEGRWQFDVAAGSSPALAAAPLLEALPAPVLAPVSPGPQPILLLRSAFAPGDRALGRNLLLGVLERLDPGIPWLLLAHEALDLLEDPRALGILQNLEARGLSVRISRESLRFLQRPEAPFTTMEDAEWQSLLGRGGLTVL